MIDPTKALILFEQNSDSIAALGNLSSNLNGKAVEVNASANAQIQKTAASCNVQVFLFYSDYITRENLLAQDNWVKMTQYGDTFAQKLDDAFKLVKSGDYKKMIYINTFAQELTKQVVDDAYKALDNADVVIGNDENNNCYLLGFTQYHNDFFANKSWDFAPNAADINAEAEKQGFSVVNLQQLTIIIA